MSYLPANMPVGRKHKGWLADQVKFQFSISTKENPLEQLSSGGFFGELMGLAVRPLT